MTNFKVDNWKWPDDLFIPENLDFISAKDFISSARSNPDVLLDQSTLTRIETKENTKNVILTFNVGSDKIEVTIP